MPFPVPFTGPPTGTLANLAMSHANAELLEITGMPSSTSAAAMIEAHFSEVQDTKIASMPPAALLAKCQALS